jgi:hypothetical protein
VADTPSDKPGPQETSANPSDEGMLRKLGLWDKDKSLSQNLSDVVYTRSQQLILAGLAAAVPVFVRQFVRDSKEMVKAGINIARS